MLWKIFYYPSYDAVFERKRIVEADTIEKAIETLVENEKPYFHCWTHYEPLKIDYTPKTKINFKKEMKE